MSLEPSRKQQRFLPPWVRPGAAARKSLWGRGPWRLRGMAEEGDEDEEMYEYDDEDGEEYSDGEEILDRCVCN